MKVFQTLYASAGNAPPQLAVTRRLVDEGHEVLVLGHEASRHRIESTGATLVPVPHGAPRHGLVPAGDRSAPRLGGPIAGHRCAAAPRPPLPGSDPRHRPGVGGGDGGLLARRRRLRLHAHRCRHRRRGGRRAVRRARALPLPVPHPGRAAVRARPAVAEDERRPGAPGSGPSHRRHRVATRSPRPSTSSGPPAVSSGSTTGPTRSWVQTGSWCSRRRSSTSRPACRCPGASASSGPPSSRATSRGSRRGPPTTSGRSW